MDVHRASAQEMTIERAASCAPCLPPSAQVLRFYGFFKEAVPESNMENHRVRRVLLLYFLADDSLQISEPKQDNSGLPPVRAGLRFRVQRWVSGFRA